MSFLPSLTHRFGRDEKGSLFVDAIIVMPMFVWGYAGMFVYWDAYRAINTVQKASYSVSDLVSRNQNTNGIDDAYITGMRTAFNRMLGGRRCRPNTPDLLHMERRAQPIRGDLFTFARQRPTSARQCITGQFE